MASTASSRIVMYVSDLHARTALIYANPRRIGLHSQCRA